MKTFLTTLIILFTSVVSPVFGKAKHEQWSEKSCTDVYNAIAIFSSLAEKKWKTDEEKAARYASAAADYATIYETVCARKQILTLVASDQPNNLAIEEIHEGEVGYSQWQERDRIQ